jgi:O-antigen/teichoic acid export membrane protein
MDPVAHVGLGGLIGLSDWIIQLLYDDRYVNAAPMLRVLAIRTAVHMVVHFCESCFVAQGASEFSFRRNLFVSVMLLIAMPIGSALGGVEGVLWGSVAAKATALFALWPEARRRGFLKLSREVLALPYLGLGYAIGWALTQVLPKF